MKKICTLFISSLVMMSCVGCTKPVTEQNSFDITYKIRKGNLDHIAEGEFVFSKESNFLFSYNDFVRKKTSEINKSIINLDTLLLDDMMGDGPHGGVYLKEGDEFTYKNPGQNLLNFMGVENLTKFDLSKFEYDDDLYDLQVFDIGYKQISYSSKNYQIFFIVLHGSSGTNDVINDLDIGYNNENYVNENTPHLEWKNKNNHKGFDVSANRTYKVISDYINSNRIVQSELIINLTGHSKGGSVANILGTMFADLTNYKTFTYTYAAPAMTTLKTNKYNSIFNLINKDDAVANIFTTKQGFYRYGQDISVSALEHKKEIENFYDGKFIYEAPSVDPLLDLLSKIFNDREDIYSFTNERKGVKTFSDREEAEEAKEAADSLIDTLKNEYCNCLLVSEIEYDEDDKEYKFEYSYTPSILLNLVSSVLRGDILNVSGPLISYCMDYVFLCIPYIPLVLRNGVMSFLKAHLMAGYKAVADSIN